MKNREIYKCMRCGDMFFIEGNEKKKCIVCGNTKISEKSVEFDVQNSGTTIENVVHGAKDTGIIKVNIKGERFKAAFACKDCGKVYEADCTEGENTVKCKNCGSPNKEMKSPKVSAFSDTKGLPNISKNWTKREIKIAKFAKRNYLRRLELENQSEKLYSLMRSLEVSDQDISNIKKNINSILNKIYKHHEKKIKKMQKE